MSTEFRTLKFRNDSAGLKDKDATLARWAAAGWCVTSETIQQGEMKGGQAFCLSAICLNMGFLAGRTPGYIVVSLARETASELATETSTLSAVDPQAQDENDTRVGGYILAGIVLIIIIWIWLKS